jgi:hypothetical protein
MAGDQRTINRISVPIVSDVSGFSRGLTTARRQAEQFNTDTTRSFSLMGRGINDRLDKITKKLGDLGKTNLGMVTAGLAGMAVAAAASAAAIATLGFSRIGDIGKDAAALNVSTEALSRLRAVARASGTDVNDMAEFVKGLTGSINESIGKSTNAAQAFRALGTSAEALAKMTPEEQIARLNKGFADLPTEAERTRVAMLLAGQDAAKVFRMLTLGTKDFKDAFDAAPIVTDDDVSEIRKLQIAIDKIGASIGSLVDMFTLKVVPAITTVADLLAGVAARFGVVVKAAATAIPTVTKAASPAAAAGPNPAQTAALQADQAAKNLAAAKAQAEAARLKLLYDKQADQLAKTRPSFVPSTNGVTMRRSPRQQRMLDQHAETGQQLGQAMAAAREAANAAKTRAQLLLEGARLAGIAKQVNDLSQEYRQTIESSGKDEIHRRVDTIKGLSPDQRKHLINQGYQAREAGKTSALRDELQESTKLPQQRLAEDLARINRLVALGPENGGLTRLQAIRAAAQKTSESGIAGSEPRYAGALDASSLEGRSYLLNQLNRTDDPVAIAKQGLALTGQGNTLLGGILTAVQARREVVVSM